MHIHESNTTRALGSDGRMRKTTCFHLLIFAALAGLAACETSASAAAKTAADTTITRMKTQMGAVDDTLQRLLGSLDSNRGKIEVRMAESAKLQENLSSNAPGVMKRLDAFVSQYKALQAELRAKDDTIKQLRDKYQGLLVAYGKEKALNAKLQSQIDSLRADTLARAHRLAQVDSARVAALSRSNAAQYVIATRKGLEDAHIVRKTERFGRLSVDPTAPGSDFTPTDVTTLKELPIAAAKDAVELVSLHPVESYSIEPGPTGSRLVIRDADAFWSTTRRLVVMIK
jgi:hypothetical protein